ARNQVCTQLASNFFRSRPVICIRSKNSRKPMTGSPISGEYKPIPNLRNSTTSFVSTPPPFYQNTVQQSKFCRALVAIRESPVTPLAGVVQRGLHDLLTVRGIELREKESCRGRGCTGKSLSQVAGPKKVISAISLPRLVLNPFEFGSWCDTPNGKVFETVSL
ncbi:MAG: hypothetical protein JWM11_3265, partial [Planctomycetaceae bacterium]|nr:hypothetical protein [Planctomycetaceae bacterium]